MPHTRKHCLWKHDAFSEEAFVGLAFGLSVLLAGCGGSSLQPTPAPSPVTKPVTWIEQDIEHEGMKISLGHRGQEPVAAITRDGQPIANAMVFCTLLSAGGEVATVYESPSGKGPACTHQAASNSKSAFALFCRRLRRSGRVRSVSRQNNAKTMGSLWTIPAAGVTAEPPVDQQWARKYAIELMCWTLWLWFNGSVLPHHAS